MAKQVEKQDSYGSCAYSRTSPKRNNMSSTTKSLNIFIPFEEALKFNLAIDECVGKLNRYKRSTLPGKQSAIHLIIHFELGRIAIKEGKI